MRKIPIDKKLHFLACYALVLTFMPFIGWWSVLITAAIGVGKELLDWHEYGRTLGWKLFWKDSKGDVFADVIGIITGVGLHFVV